MPFLRFNSIFPFYRWIEVKNQIPRSYSAENRVANYGLRALRVILTTSHSIFQQAGAF
jgi:hypothetical protein